MTDPLRVERPRMSSRGEDLGDVLASIRRLIAQDDHQQTARPAADDQPAVASAERVVIPVPAASVTAAPDSDPVSAPQGHATVNIFTDRGALVWPAEDSAMPARMQPPLSPDRTAALTTSLADAVEAAAARMAETTRRIEEVKATRGETPLRLHPDALIPAAPRNALGASAAPVPARLSLVDHEQLVFGAESHGVAAAVLPKSDDPTETHHTPSPVDAAPDSAPDWPQGNDMAIRPLAASAEMPPEAASIDHPDMIALPAATQDTPATEQFMDAHPLRNLLREAIREELRGEIGEEFHAELRKLVRDELAAVLTEAFGQPGV